MKKELSLIRKVGEWSQINFGTQPAYRQILGISEELLFELPGLAEGQDEEAQDAFGDALIFACDHVIKGDYLNELVGLLESGQFWDHYVLGTFEEALYDGPHQIIGAMCQVQLKHDQKIKKWADTAVYKSSMARLWMCLYFWMDGKTEGFWGLSVIDIATKIFDETVAKRDWNKHREEEAAKRLDMVNTHATA